MMLNVLYIYSESLWNGKCSSSEECLQQGGGSIGHYVVLVAPSAGLHSIYRIFCRRNPNLENTLQNHSTPAQIAGWGGAVLSMRHCIILAPSPSFEVIWSFFVFPFFVVVGWLVAWEYVCAAGFGAILILILKAPPPPRPFQVSRGGGGRMVSLQSPSLMMMGDSWIVYLFFFSICLELASVSA